ncbi:MAG: hypothetical protein ACI86M_000650 [Saprospiraceae bacterium]|jgi:hypothetical protein
MKVIAIAEDNEGIKQSLLEIIELSRSQCVIAENEKIGIKR